MHNRPQSALVVKTLFNRQPNVRQNTCTNITSCLNRQWITESTFDTKYSTRQMSSLAKTADQKTLISIKEKLSKTQSKSVVVSPLAQPKRQREEFKRNTFTNNWLDCVTPNLQKVKQTPEQQSVRINSTEQIVKRQKLSLICAPVMSENDELGIAYNRLQQLDRDTGIRNKHNLSEMLQDVKIGFQSLQYQIRRIICTEEQQHIVFPSAKETKIFVVAQTQMHFKVSVAGKKAPARLLITYDDPDHIDLRVFYSWSDKIREPELSNYNEMFTGPKRVTLSPSLDHKNQEFYQGKWIYLTFLSNHGCSLSATILFKDEALPRKQVQPKPVKTETFNYECSSILPSKTVNDAILRNIEMASQYNQTRIESLKQRSLESEVRWFQAQLKRQQRDESQVRLRHFQLIKWQILRQRKEQMTIQVSEKQKQSSRLYRIVLLAKIRKLVQKVFRKWLQHKFIIQLDAIKKRSAEYIVNFMHAIQAKRITEALKTQIKQRPFQADMNINHSVRMRLIMRYCLMFEVPAISNQLQHKASKHILKVLTDSSESLVLLNRMSSFFEYVLRIQRSYRYKLKMNLYLREAYQLALTAQFDVFVQAEQKRKAKREAIERIKQIQCAVTEALAAQMLRLQTILQHTTLLFKILAASSKNPQFEPTAISIKAIYDSCAEALIGDKVVREDLFKMAKNRYIKVFPRTLYQLIIKKAVKLEATPKPEESRRSPSLQTQKKVKK